MTTLSLPPGFGGPLQQSPQQSQPDPIKRSRERRVSFATGENLCEIRLFAAEDAPNLSGTSQELLQAKPTRNLHIFNSTSSLPAPDAPPGFGGVTVKPKPDLVALAAIMPQLSWRPPSVFNLDPAWHVVAGEASLEIDCQKQREVRVLEAVYPRPSSIPESPAEPLEAQEPYDDSSTSQIPLVPLDEEDLPDGMDMSSSPSGPRFSHGSLGPVAGAQNNLPNAAMMSNGRSEKVKQYVGDNLLGPMQENALARKDSTWRDSPAVFSGRSSFMSHSSDPMRGRPPLAGLPSDVYSEPSDNAVEPDVAAAAAAAFAALSKSQESGSMIDNELLIQILKDPGLIESLTSKAQLTLANSKSNMNLSSIGLNGIIRGADKTNQAQAMNGVTSNSNQWVSLPSTSYASGAAGGQEESRSRIGEAYSNGVEKFQRTAGSDERTSTILPLSMGTSQPYTASMNGRVGSGIIPRLSNSSDAPPGFGNGIPTTKPRPIPGFGGKSAPRQGSQTVTPQVGPTPARPLSKHDEQYYKSLIMQHGCKSADDDDHGRAGMETKGNTGARLSNPYNIPETKRWFGREEVDGARPERTGRDRRDVDRTGMETVTRAKSRKLCIYFGTSRGCRNGDNCTFVHELSETDKAKDEKVRSAPPAHYSKRLKVDG